jgi:hypothetical protein
MLIMVLITYPLQNQRSVLHKMDHVQTASLSFASRTKSIDVFMRLSVAIIGMIAHSHGVVKTAYFSLNIYPNDFNHIVGLVAKLLLGL